jgi:1-acyl-sn-glycerol-3-phosphate acyltransferase
LVGVEGLIGLKERINLIEVPEAVPQRGNRFTRFLGQLYTALISWRYAGEIPDLPKFVLILAPHTSNVDFAVGLAPLFALGLRLSFMAKSSLFWEPFGTYLRWLGGTPIKRKASGGYVDQAINQFQQHDQFVLLITPEGTRTKVDRWRTGFYHIAHGAGVPLLPVTFDYGFREFRFGKPLMPTGDMEADIKTLQAFFHAGQARKPDNY